MIKLDCEPLEREGLAALPGRKPVVLEIGFGRGELLLDLASQDPERAHLGVEVSRKRVEKVARRAARAQLSNLRLVHATAEYLVGRILPAACVGECWINFPDPWPKKRHLKRRLIRPEFLEALARVLAPGARLHLATDHPGYAGWIAKALPSCPALRNRLAPASFGDRPPARRQTAYEAEFLAAGRRIAYFELERCE
ncbi:MAG: tRNA (guanosine(46)-N7)-methyltransferase TrmB [Myxococcota bacterium]